MEAGVSDHVSLRPIKPPTFSTTLAEELGIRPLVAHCHLALGKLHRRTGKRQQASEHFSTAMTMYREMDMRFWLEKAEAELAELR